ncbi:MAG: NADH-quinone oxidoreductase subunit H [Acidobacteria bacterium]|nr:NADH-quinone oxidoreductase subunit H [Acidobacteriota bacterium]MBI3282290.1 NADH-quinone oxidoreductase subunit H [Acidobacteriota bacterium]
MNFYILTLIKAGLVAFVLLTTAAYLVWIERKLLAHIQLRLGPQRVGPHGLLQPLADLVKLVTKEGLIPQQVNKIYFLLAPFAAVMLALISISVIPFGPEVEIFGQRTWLQLTDLKIGVLFVLAISSIGVYGVALGGWASNNKYALLGGLRSSAQMISYELPLALAIAAPLLLSNTLSFRELVETQSGFLGGVLGNWNLWYQPVSFLVFLISAFAETNRVPFDLPEAENELVAGFHTEYSSLGFAAFFTAEYANIITACAVGTHIWLGGWQPIIAPHLGGIWVPSLVFAFFGIMSLFHATQPARRWDKYTFPVLGLAALGLAALFAIPLLQPVLVPLFWFAAKTGALIFLFIWIRGTLPRFRYDQLMRFAWTFLFPVALVNLLVTGLVVALQP